LCKITETGLLGLKMRVEHTIHINADLSSVWKVTENIESWPEWTPTVTSVKKITEGPLKVGSQIKLKQPGQAESLWQITKFVPNATFQWESKRAGLQFVATHELSQETDGIYNALQVDVEGFFGVLLWPILKGAIRKALIKENNGLKKRCEEIAGA
jgi:hypothetical protein